MGEINHFLSSAAVQGTIELGAVAGDAVSIAMPGEQQLIAGAALRHPPTANMQVPTPSVRNSMTVGSSVSSLQLPNHTMLSSGGVASSFGSSGGHPLGVRPRSPPTYMHPANVAVRPQVGTGVLERLQCASETTCDLMTHPSASTSDRMRDQQGGQLEWQREPHLWHCQLFTCIVLQSPQCIIATAMELMHTCSIFCVYTNNHQQKLKQHAEEGG